jgi:hypothetical protein
VAVNSRSNSTLLTVISMVPTATAASTGIDVNLPCRRLLLALPLYQIQNLLNQQ